MNAVRSWLPSKRAFLEVASWRNSPAASVVSSRVPRACSVYIPCRRRKLGLLQSTAFAQTESPIAQFKKTRQDRICLSCAVKLGSLAHKSGVQGTQVSLCFLCRTLRLSTELKTRHQKIALLHLLSKAEDDWESDFGDLPYRSRAVCGGWFRLLWTAAKKVVDKDSASRDRKRYTGRIRKLLRNFPGNEGSNVHAASA